MSYKLLWIPTSLFASALLFAVACEPCEGDECDFDDGGGAGGAETGGQGGSTSTGGVSSGGASSGGAASGGAGGMGGGTTTELDCLASGDPVGTPGSCQPTVDEADESYACQACIAEYCCAEAEACGASDPYTACYYGSTSRLDFGGEPIVGEVDCILDCLREIPDDEFVGDEFEIDACAAECGSAECDEAHAGETSTALASCLVGIDNETAPAGCRYECGIVAE